LLCSTGHWELLGLAYWVIEEKQTGDFVGEVGFANYKREIVPPLGSLCIGVQFSWRAIGVGLLSMLSVRYWGLGPVNESTG
jgi:RimJ/RimL family protein N-acetyltransferase